MPSTISFEDARNSFGLWLSVRNLQEIIDNSLFFTGKFKLNKRRWLTEHYRQEICNETDHKFWHFYSVIPDFVAYPRIFVDALAAKRKYITPSLLSKKLGKLADIFTFVVISADVFREACEYADLNVELLQSATSVRRLEQHADFHVLGGDLFDGQLKDYFDGLDKRQISDQIFRIPARYVDSDGSVERLILYSVIQSFAKCPIRLRRPTIELFDRLPPLVERFLLDNHDPNLIVEKRISDKINIVSCAPDLLSYLEDMYVSSDYFQNFSDVIFYLRQQKQVKSYQDWLRNLYLLLHDKEYAAAQKHIDEVDGHIDSMIEIGNSNTRRTIKKEGSVGITFLPFPITFTMNKSLKIPRQASNDFIGFIGNWITPRRVVKQEERRDTEGDARR